MESRASLRSALHRRLPKTHCFIFTQSSQNKGEVISGGFFFFFLKKGSVFLEVNFNFGLEGFAMPRTTQEEICAAALSWMPCLDQRFQSKTDLL